MIHSVRFTRRAVPVLILAILLSGCGPSNFAKDLRLALSLSAPLIDSLVASGVIPASARETYIRDFTDLANGAAVLSDDLKGCADNVCKVNAVERYEHLFWDVLRRGHFKVSPKLQNVEAILKGILDAAKLYYSPRLTRDTVSDKEREADIKARIQALKVAMKQ